MMLLVAGAAGLPFAEDLTSLIKIFFAFARKVTGDESIRLNTEADLRQYIKDIDGNPDLMLHGLSGSFLNLWDLSGSIGQGSIVPGLNALEAGVSGRKSYRGGGGVLQSKSLKIFCIFTNKEYIY